MKYSIIMPIYNAERYLRESIESILEQTEESWELLLINDGSTDGSDKICKEYVCRDDRIIYSSRENKGVSRTRNEGIVKSKGKYIIFLDADDKLRPVALERINKYIEKYSPDVVSYYTLRTDEKMQIIGPFASRKYNEVKLIKSVIDFRNEIYKELIQGNSFGIIGNYAVSSQLAKGIRFDDEMIMCEDLLFNMCMFEKAKNVLIIPEYLYLYRDNRCGRVRTYNLKKIENKKKMVKEKIEFGERNAILFETSLIYNWFCSDLVYDYWSIIGNRRLEREFLDYISQDTEIMDMFQNVIKENHGHILHPDFRYIVGNRLERFFLRNKVLIKNSLKLLIHNCSRKV